MARSVCRVALALAVVIASAEERQWRGDDVRQVTPASALDWFRDANHGKDEAALCEADSERDVQEQHEEVWLNSAPTQASEQQVLATPADTQQWATDGNSEFRLMDKLLSARMHSRRLLTEASSGEDNGDSSEPVRTFEEDVSRGDESPNEWQDASAVVSVDVERLLDDLDAWDLGKKGDAATVARRRRALLYTSSVSGDNTAFVGFAAGAERLRDPRTGPEVTQVCAIASASRSECLNYLSSPVANVHDNVTLRRIFARAVSRETHTSSARATIGKRLAQTSPSLRERGEQDSLPWARCARSVRRAAKVCLGRMGSWASTSTIERA